ncbi:MAG: sugar phosphate isomerase/epimerase family protein [Thermoplasmatota archaeon]
MNPIAVSVPALSHIPVEEAAPMVSREFGVWEVVAEHRHSLGAIRSFMADFLSSHELALQVHAPLSDINVSSFSERLREASIAELVEAIRVSAELGARCVTVHPGVMSPVSRMDPERVRALTVDAMRRVDGAREEFGVPVAVENMPHMRALLFQSPGELLELIEGTGLGICFDAGHAHTCGNVEAFLGLAPRFLNVHIHDNMGDRDDHLVLGRGTAPIPAVLRALKGYRGALVIEANSLDEAVESRGVLEGLLAGLR